MNTRKGNIEFVKYAVFAFILLSIIFYERWHDNKIRKYGVYTIAKVDHQERAADVGDLHVDIYYGNEVRRVRLNKSCGGCDGKFFFVKVQKDDPFNNILFYENNPVPNCILKNPIPSEGWKEMPVCKD